MFLRPIVIAYGQTLIFELVEDIPKIVPTN